MNPPSPLKMGMVNPPSSPRKSEPLVHHTTKLHDRARISPPLQLEGTSTPPPHKLGMIKPPTIPTSPAKENGGSKDNRGKDNDYIEVCEGLKESGMSLKSRGVSSSVAGECP